MIRYFYIVFISTIFTSSLSAMNSQKKYNDFNFEEFDYKENKYEYNQSTKDITLNHYSCKHKALKHYINDQIAHEYLSRDKKYSYINKIYIADDYRTIDASIKRYEKKIKHYIKIFNDQAIAIYPNSKKIIIYKIRPNTSECIVNNRIFIIYADLYLDFNRKMYRYNGETVLPRYSIDNIELIRNSGIKFYHSKYGYNNKFITNNCRSYFSDYRKKPKLLRAFKNSLPLIFEKCGVSAEIIDELVKIKAIPKDLLPEGFYSVYDYIIKKINKLKDVDDYYDFITKKDGIAKINRLPAEEKNYVFHTMLHNITQYSLENNYTANTPNNNILLSLINSIDQEYEHYFSALENCFEYLLSINQKFNAFELLINQHEKADNKIKAKIGEDIDCIFSIFTGIKPGFNISLLYAINNLEKMANKTYLTKEEFFITAEEFNKAMANNLLELFEYFRR